MRRVSTGIPGYGLRTEMIRKFFPFPLWKRFRKIGIPERFFLVYATNFRIIPFPKWKFFSGKMETLIVRLLQNSRIDFTFDYLKKKLLILDFITEPFFGLVMGISVRKY